MVFDTFERMVAFRYLRARRQEGFISVIAIVSFIGIMLAVAVLIIVMSVMNGFRVELLGRIIGINGHLGIYAPQGRIGVVQIAGLVARRIVSFVREGQTIGAGERFGLIRFGSRLDVYLPEGTTSLVSEGQTAIAGETILADFRVGDSGRTFRAN